MSEVRFVTNIVKEYKDMFKIVVYKEPKMFITPGYLSRRKVVNGDYTPSVSSLRRTKTTIQDIVLCNDFELFCTFTFDPKKVDRFNYNICSSCMRRWLSHQRELSLKHGKVLKYIIIPEQHKNGAWHFHALMSGYSSTLKDTGLKTSSLRSIYNITSFRLGFTTAVKVDNNSGVSTYITKYITKSFVNRFNGRKFFCSQNLVRPKRELNSSFIMKIKKSFPLAMVLVSENHDEFIFHVDKKNLCDNIELDNSKVAQYGIGDFSL